MLHRYLAVQATTRTLRRRSVPALAAFISFFTAATAVSFPVVMHTAPNPVAVRWIEWTLVAMKSVILLLCASAASAYVYVSVDVPRPIQLHANGIALLLMLVELSAYGWGGSLYNLESPLTAWSLFFVARLCADTRKVIFFLVATGKMSALGSRTAPCCRIRFWGCGLILIVPLMTLSGSAGLAVLAYLVLAGHSRDEAMWMAHSLEVSSVEGKVFRACTVVGSLAALALVVLCLGFLCSAWRLTRGVVAKLVERDPASELLKEARSTVRRHFSGVLVSVSTTCLSLVAQAVGFFGLVGRPDVEYFLSVGGMVLDEVGDIVGILLLSGIAVLLRNRGAEAGDVSSHISGLLHSAVLTSRATTVFEGHVAKTPGNLCVASFPGKYWQAWNSLTWKCEQGELSSACVFLPASDAKGRFGGHVPNPETPTRGKCWCSSLYGDVKPWGCQWFAEWRANVEKAASLGLDLVVVYFPSETGQGKVAWADLPTSNLWDGVGLGGSQKGEVAYLQRQGFPIIEEDLDAFRRRLGV